MSQTSTLLEPARPSQNHREHRWRVIADSLDYAFQPIVNIHTGLSYGCEALLRNFEAAGFRSIQDVFDTACNEHMSFFLDIILREKVIRKFMEIPFHDHVKLFYNIDNRTLLTPEYSQESVASIPRRLGFPTYNFCIEISERHDFNTFILHDFKSLAEIKSILKSYKQDFFKVAIDDFGSGLSGLELLYHSEPDYIKIDRFFINEIASDSRKYLFVSSILNMAHILGVVVIAEGVETEREFYVCKQIGCDLIQGYLVQRPTVQITDIKERYELVEELNRRDKRERGSDRSIIIDQLEYIEPIPLHKADHSIIDMGAVFDCFRRNKVYTFFPIINGQGEPIGVVREKDLKDYVYSPYGMDLLKNKTSGGKLSNFVTRLPISEINTRVEKILEIYAMDIASDGILMTENGRYTGFLSTNALIRLVNEKNLAEARDQNPLTRLPGNTIINKVFAESLLDTSSYCVFIYFDFDNFKPFNDKYGFRQGDRAILMFADMLKELSNRFCCFIGHIGGDDFVVRYCTESYSPADIEHEVTSIIARFSGDVLSMYKPQDRDRGYFISTNREGARRRFPLLGVSAGVLVLPPTPRDCSIEDIFGRLALLKQTAKKSLDHFALETLVTITSGEDSVPGE